MSTQTQTGTLTVRAIVPGQAAQDVTVAAGTTVAGLAQQLGLQGAGSLSALDSMMNSVGPNDVITEDMPILNYIYKLAGA